MEHLPNEILEKILFAAKGAKCIGNFRLVNSKWNFFATKAIKPWIPAIECFKNAELLDFFQSIKNRGGESLISKFHFSFGREEDEWEDLSLLFTLHGHHIRHLNLYYGISFQKFRASLCLLQHVNFLTHLCISASFYESTMDDTDLAQLPNLFPTTFPHLVFMEFGITETFSNETPFWEPNLIAAFLARCPKLTRVRLRIHAGNTPLSHVLDLLSTVKQVPSLALRMCCPYPIDTELLPETLPKLTELEIWLGKSDVGYPQFVSNVLLWLEYQSETLKSLKLVLFSNLGSVKLPALKVLKWLSLNFQDQCKLSTFVPFRTEQFPVVETIKLEGYSDGFGIFDPTNPFPTVVKFAFKTMLLVDLPTQVRWDLIFCSVKSLTLSNHSSAQLKPFIHQMTWVEELNFGPLIGDHLEGVEDGKQIQKVLAGIGEDATTSLANFTRLQHLQFKSPSVLPTLLHFAKHGGMNSLATLFYGRYMFGNKEVATENGSSLFLQFARIEISPAEIKLLQSFHKDVRVIPREFLNSN